MNFIENLGFYCIQLIHHFNKKIEIEEEKANFGKNN